MPVTWQRGLKVRAQMPTAGRLHPTTRNTFRKASMPVMGMVLCRETTDDGDFLVIASGWAEVLPKPRFFRVRASTLRDASMPTVAWTSTGQVETDDRVIERARRVVEWAMDMKEYALPEDVCAWHV